MFDHCSVRPVAKAAPPARRRIAPFASRRRRSQAQLVRRHPQPDTSARQSGAEAFAMCAIDALGIPLLARQRAEVRSREAVNGEPVRVLVAPDRSARSESADLVVIAGRTGDGPSAGACCPHLNFVSDRASAAELLAATTRLKGEVLDLAEPVALGRAIFGDLIGEDDA